MGAIDCTPQELEICGEFLKKIVEESTNKSCPLKSLCFCMTYDEVEGELIDVLNRYLHESRCPRLLVPPLINHVKNKFLQEDLQSYQLKRQLLENEIKEYDGAAVTKALYTCFITTCSQLSNELNTMKLQKTLQKCTISFHSIKNTRRKMEDRHFFCEDLNGLFDLKQATSPQAVFAVFDGHGGTDAANYAASQFVCKLKDQENLISSPDDALRKAIIETDSDFVSKAERERLKSGATAVIALIQDKNLTIAWLGDSQVVLCKDGDAVQLMEPHKPDRQDERERIEALGGCVVFFGGWRVNGSLSVSRAIGDYEQRPFITSEPQVEEYEMEGDEEFLILACDGLWDTVEPFDATKSVQCSIKKGTREQAAEVLVELAKKNGSMDNITVMVVYLDFNNKSDVSPSPQVACTSAVVEGAAVNE